MTIHLITSPPFGERFWTLVQQRMMHHGYEVSIHTPMEHHYSMEKMVEQLSLVITHNDSVVAHGLGVPLLLAFANAHRIKHAFISNGPLKNLDPLCSTFSKLPLSAQQLYLHPRISFRYFRSSLGMRRSVVNPYVMDEETVSTVCAPLQNAATRKNMALYLVEIASFEPPYKIDAPLTLIWGDHDLLYPISVCTEIQTRYPHSQRFDIEGGKIFHPIERPWAIADIIHNQLSTASISQNL